MEETHVASPPLRKKFFWVLFYIAGCTFTIIYWKKSIENFYSYPSLITEERHQSDKEKSWTFPNINICANSMHSKLKLEMAGLNHTVIEQLYGSYSTLGGLPKTVWKDLIDKDLYNENMPENFKELNEIDLATLFENTRSFYFVVQCQINTHDCRDEWELKRTIAGTCLQYNPQKAFVRPGQSFEMPKRVTLTLSMGYNFSDTSFGWNGYNEGFTIYYPHFSELIPSQHSSFSLSAGLTPVIDFQNVERTLLGAPYTKCKPTRTSNSYLTKTGLLPSVEPYRKNLCEFTRLLIDIDKKCQCYPSYIDNVTDLFLMENHETKNLPCNFFQHAVCVSEIIDHFQLISAGTCLPACTEHSFKPQSIQYMQVSERRSKDIHEYLNIPEDIYIASMVLKLSDEVSVVYKEQSTYDPSKFIADMGGTAGVVLGLSLLSILKHLEKMYLNMLDKFRSILINYKLRRRNMATKQTMRASQISQTMNNRNTAQETFCFSDIQYHSRS